MRIYNTNEKILSTVYSYNNILIWFCWTVLSDVYEILLSKMNIHHTIYLDYLIISSMNFAFFVPYNVHGITNGWSFSHYLSVITKDSRIFTYSSTFFCEFLGNISCGMKLFYAALIIVGRFKNKTADSVNHF